ncbi:hypothetical protein BHE74_00058154 [Ensete ventricosum]|nr:hypothetical protein BHE74_00058154 [Ensete ventricosum]
MAYGCTNTGKYASTHHSGAIVSASPLDDRGSVSSRVLSEDPYIEASDREWGIPSRSFAATALEQQRWSNPPLYSIVIESLDLASSTPTPLAAVGDTTGAHHLRCPQPAPHLQSRPLCCCVPLRSSARLRKEPHLLTSYLQNLLPIVEVLLLHARVLRTTVVGTTSVNRTLILYLLSIFVCRSHWSQAPSCLVASSSSIVTRLRFPSVSTVALSKATCSLSSLVLFYRIPLPHCGLLH